MLAAGNPTARLFAVAAGLALLAHAQNAAGQHGGGRKSGPSVRPLWESPSVGQTPPGSRSNPYVRPPSRSVYLGGGVRPQPPGSRQPIVSPLTLPGIKGAMPGSERWWGDRKPRRMVVGPIAPGLPEFSTAPLPKYTPPAPPTAPRLKRPETAALPQQGTLKSVRKNLAPAAGGPAPAAPPLQFYLPDLTPPGPLLNLTPRAPRTSPAVGPPLKP